MSRTLQAQGLVKSFKGRTVVCGVDLDVGPGEVVGLLGPNGAGKTTTFKMILGLVRPDSGTVRFGEELDRLPLHRRAKLGLGYLPQGPSVFQGMSVRDNLRAILEALGVDGATDRAGELLEKLGLTHLAGQKARTLSGGERRRLEFARALCSNPSILLCDEPFSGVDPIAADEISEIVGELKGDGVGVLLTDHSVRKALSVCDRIYLIVDGNIVDKGTPQQIRQSEISRRLYLGKEFD